MRCKFLFLCITGYLLFSATYAQTMGQMVAKEVHELSRMINNEIRTGNAASRNPKAITIFMCGDVMTGRGIDQVLPYPSDPKIYESYMKSARGYINLAQKVNGAIDYPVSFAYIWGDALIELDRVVPDVRLVNLETSVTQSNDYWKGKGINYRMHPDNIPSLTVAKLDVCALANNHVLDWGYSGLLETLESLTGAKLKIAGAGRNLAEAQAVAAIKVPGKGRVLVFAFGLKSGGIPPSWGATETKPGVNLLKGLTDENLRGIKEKVGRVKRKGDIVVASIHWGSNWGYRIPREQIHFAHRLVDEAGIDIIHGHSSHHVRALEIYGDKLILYGCGDFINDYEGISGYEDFRADLSLMYFATVDSLTGKLLELQMTPTQIRRFKVIRASKKDTRWLRDTLNREGTPFGTVVKVIANDRLALQRE